MDRRLLAFGIVPMLLLASCSTPNRSVSPEAHAPLQEAPAYAPQAALAPALPARAPASRAASVDGYKKLFAERIYQSNPDVFHDPLPKILKSIVILDVTIDRDGRVSNVFVTRSNGFKNLEKIALNNVRRAAPYASPAGLRNRSDGSLNFMETFLFRDDGRFQVRSLAGIQ